MKRNLHSPLSQQHPAGLRPFESNHCEVYAIELDPSAIEDADFAANNPNWIPGMTCLYFGMSSHSPEERFTQHISGSKNASRIAHKYGRKLRMDLVPSRKPTRRTWAMKLEKRLAKEFRMQGYAVWQA